MAFFSDHILSTEIHRNRSENFQMKTSNRTYIFFKNSKINARASISVFLFQCALFVSIFGFAIAERTSSDGSFIRQLIWILFGLTAFIHIFRDYINSRRLNYNWGGGSILLLILYAFLSAAWSTDFSATIKRSMLLLIVLLLSVACFGENKKDNISLDRVLGLPIFILIALSILVTLIAPGSAITEIGWRGVTSHKNEIGQVIVVALLTVIFGTSHKSAGLVRRALLVLMLVVGLYLSKSSTSLMAFAVAVAVTSGLSLALSIRWVDKWIRPFLIIALLSTAAIHVAFLTDNLPAFGQINGLLFSSLGKSETLTGRTELWNLVLSQSIYHNPLFGGGYGGFWNGPYSIAAYTTFRNGIYLGQAHNGYIDIYNDMGWLGLSLVILIIIRLFYNILRLMKRRRYEWKLLLSISIAILIANYAESTLMRTTQFLNIIFFATVIFSQRLLATEEE